MEALAELIWPVECSVCKRPSRALCDECQGKIVAIDQATACPRCGAPFGSLLCTECWNAEGIELSDIDELYSYGLFEPLLGEVIKAYKDAHELSLVSLFVQYYCKVYLAHADELGHATLLSYIPATNKALQKRGFDHMQLLAQPLARVLGLPLVSLLALKDKRDLRRLSREDRKREMSAVMTITRGVAGQHVLLIDDVVTTGATMREAAALLKRASARRVSALSLARVW